MQVCAFTKSIMAETKDFWDSWVAEYSIQINSPRGLLSLYIIEALKKKRLEKDMAERLLKGINQLDLRSYCGYQELVDALDAKEAIELVTEDQWKVIIHQLIKLDQQVAPELPKAQSGYDLLVKQAENYLALTKQPQHIVLSGPFMWNKLDLSAKAIFGYFLIYTLDLTERVTIDGFVYRFEKVPFPLPLKPTMEWYIVDLINNRGIARTNTKMLESRLTSRIASGKISKQLLLQAANEIGFITTELPLHSRGNFYSMLQLCSKETGLSVAYLYWEYEMVMLLHKICAAGIQLIFTGGAAVSLVWRHFSRLSSNLDISFRPDGPPAIRSWPNDAQETAREQIYETFIDKIKDNGIDVSRVDYTEGAYMLSVTCNSLVEFPDPEATGARILTNIAQITTLEVTHKYPYSMVKKTAFSLVEQFASQKHLCPLLLHDVEVPCVDVKQIFVEKIHAVLHNYRKWKRQPLEELSFARHYTDIGLLLPVILVLPMSRMDWQKLYVFLVANGIVKAPLSVKAECFALTDEDVFRKIDQKVALIRNTYQNTQEHSSLRKIVADIRDFLETNAFDEVNFYHIQEKVKEGDSL